MLKIDIFTGSLECFVRTGIHSFVQFAAYVKQSSLWL